MKFNYFKIIEDKYKSRISANKPIIIRLDGKQVTKSKEINMLDESPGEFAYSLKKTASYISRKFNCIVFTSSDEISLVITDSSRLFRLYGSFECQKISSLITQDVGYKFNSYYNGNTIYFDARTFNINPDKVSSYIIFRIKASRNVHSIYFAKRRLAPYERIGKKIQEVELALETFYPEFRNRTEYQKHGCCFFKGNLVDSQVILDNYNTIDFYSLDNNSNIYSKGKVIIVAEENDDKINLNDDLFDFI